VIKAVTLVVPDQLNLGTCGAATSPRAWEFRFETLGQPKARTVGNMDAGEWRKEAVVTDRLARVELGERGLQQIPQKRHRPHGHPLLQGFRRDPYGYVELRGFRCQLGHGGVRRTPPAKRHQGQKQFARNLRGALDKLGGNQASCLR
jgi:hypothetical protein